MTELGESLLADHKIVFIAGLHRSGTSVLHRALRNHPDITGFDGTGAPEDEGQHLQTVYPPAADYGGEGWFGFKSGSHLTEASPLVTAENRHRLLSQWAAYWETEKSVLVEKSPPNLIRMRFLQGLYPEAYFIVITRHPVAVSYSTQKWSSIVPQNSRLYPFLSRFGQPFGSLFKHWLTCHQTFLQDHPHLQRVYMLKYEQFARKPLQFLDAIYSFLDIAPHQYDGEPISDQNGKYFDAWGEKRKTPYARRLIQRYEPSVNRYGYSLDDLDRAGDLEI